MAARRSPPRRSSARRRRRGAGRPASPRRRGALVYNLAHTTALPALLLATGVLLTLPWALAASLVWLAHIGFDRMLGYGLKSPAGFGVTHLGMIGRTRG